MMETWLCACEMCRVWKLFQSTTQHHQELQKLSIPLHQTCMASMGTFARRLGIKPCSRTRHETITSWPRASRKRAVSWCKDGSAVACQVLDGTHHVLQRLVSCKDTCIQCLVPASQAVCLPKMPVARAVVIPSLTILLSLLWTMYL